MIFSAGPRERHAMSPEQIHFFINLLLWPNDNPVTKVMSAKLSAPLGASLTILKAAVVAPQPVDHAVAARSVVVIMAPAKPETSRTGLTERSEKCSGPWP
jgi:hypothetical protein